MKKKRKKRINRKNFLKRKSTSTGLIPVLFIISAILNPSEVCSSKPNLNSELGVCLRCIK